MKLPLKLIVIPTYNERQTLPDLLEQLWRLVPDSDVIVVDDNSPDGTGAWCQAQCAIERRLRLVNRASKDGLGSATLLGLRAACEGPYEFVATMDADFSHEPQSLPTMLQRIQTVDTPQVDVVIGSRYVPGGTIENWTIARRLASKLLNHWVRFWLGLRPRDNSSAFRVYRVAALRHLDLADIRSAGYAYLEEILFRLQRGGARIEEVPIRFRNRSSGHSKANLGEAWGIARRAVELRFERSYHGPFANRNGLASKDS